LEYQIQVKRITVNGVRRKQPGLDIVKRLIAFEIIIPGILVKDFDRSEIDRRECNPQPGFDQVSESQTAEVVVPDFERNVHAVTGFGIGSAAGGHHVFIGPIGRIVKP
jgi:hypothetical protein